MIYVIPGILGFIACCLFDINKIRWNIRFLNLFFVIGSVLLIGSSILCILQADFSSIFSNFGLYHWLMLLGLLLSIAGEIYALFFAHCKSISQKRPSEIGLYFSLNIVSNA